MSNPFKNLETRTLIAFSIVSFAIYSILNISSTVLNSKGQNDTSVEIERRATLVLSSTLPLFGTWVGTILAYYFAKESFQAGSENNQRLAELSLQSNSNSNNLQSILVEAAMTPKDKMYFIKEISTTIRSILNDFDNKKLRRLPVLSPDETLVEVVYYEDLSGYLNAATAPTPIPDPATVTNPATATAPTSIPIPGPATVTNPATAPTPANIDGLTIGDYLKLPSRRIPPVAFIVPKANIAFTRESMKLTSPDCRDIIVTEDGTKGSKVLGYLTNTDIERLSKV